MSRSKTLIYGLVDPRDGAVRYIGKSTSGLERPRSHSEPNRLRSDPNLHKVRWLQQVIAAGLKPEVRVLEEMTPGDLDDGERFWIAQGRGLGWPLTNLTAGGDGTAGIPTSPRQRAAVRKVWAGRKHTPESRAKMSEAVRASYQAGHPLSPGLLRGWTGKRHSAEARAKIGASQIGNQRGLGHAVSPEARARIAEGQRRAAARRRAAAPPKVRINLLPRS